MAPLNRFSCSSGHPLELTGQTGACCQQTLPRPCEAGVCVQEATFSHWLEGSPGAGLLHSSWLTLGLSQIPGPALALAHQAGQL